MIYSAVGDLLLLGILLKGCGVKKKPSPARICAAAGFLAAFVLLHGFFSGYSLPVNNALLQDNNFIILSLHIARNFFVAYFLITALLSVEKVDAAVKAMLFSLCIRIGSILTYGPLLMLGNSGYWVSAVQPLLSAPQARLLSLVVKLIILLILMKNLRDIRMESLDRIQALLLVSIILSIFIANYVSIIFRGLSQYAAASRIIMAFFGFSMLCMLLAFLWHGANRENKKRIGSLQEVIRNSYLAVEKKQAADKTVMRMYHDVKKQLAAIAALNDSAAIKGIAEALQGQLKDYERVAYTKNPVLDTILNEKMAEAAQAGVVMKVVMDFSAGGFLDNMDVCSIFHNALSNAIYAAGRVEDREKRKVSVCSFSRGAFLVIRVENFFSGPLRWEGAELRSTKPDAQMHGIGLDSIRYSVGKYGGEAIVEPTEDYFSLKIAIPIPPGRETMEN